MKKALYLFLIGLMIGVLGTITVAQSEMIKLAWDANSESDLAGYKIYMGSASRTYGEPVDVGNITTYELDVVGEPRYFAVTAYDLNGNESGYSNEVTYDAPPAPPGGCMIIKIP